MERHWQLSEEPLWLEPMNEVDQLGEETEPRSQIIQETMERMLSTLSSRCGSNLNKYNFKRFKIAIL